MFYFLEKGGPIMWPLLITSLITLSVVIERFLFVCREFISQRSESVDSVLNAVKEKQVDKAVKIGKDSDSFVARTLAHGLEFRHSSFSEAVFQQASRELKRFSKGLSVLDTVITLAPLLGLFGTIVGMIRAFGLLGANELQAPTAITGGIAEALIATGFGLVIAIVALIPFNYLNGHLENARYQIEDASTQLEFALNQIKE